MQRVDKHKIKDYFEWYLLIAIPIVGTILFSIIPLILTVKDSLFSMNGNFVGITNYEILFQDIEFQQSVVNTIYMGILGTVANIPLAFILANMMNNINWGRNIYKTVFLLPMIMSMVTVALLFKFIFSADPNSVANSLVRFFGAQPFGWFNDPAMSRETVIMMAVWKGIGYNIILFFAGLQTIPREYYEAAEIDGANEFRQWLHITIPCMKNTFTFVYITTAITVFKRFADVYAVSGEFGTPAGSLFTIMLYIYRKTFSTRFSKDLGVGAAASLVLFAIILIITIINYKLTEDSDSEQKVKVRR